MGTLPVRAVIFDLDDTLMDDAACTRAGLAALLGTYGEGQDWLPEQLFQRHAEIIKAIEPLLFRGLVSVHEARTLRYQRLLGELGVQNVDGDAATRTYRAAYRAAWTEVEGAGEVVRMLKGRGLRVGVLTNYVRDLQAQKLDFLGLMPLVDALLCAADPDVPAPKPDPRSYLAACAALRVRPSEAVMVGDSWDNDVQGAREAGLRAMWLNRTGEQAPDPAVPTVRRLAELPPLLE